MPKDDMERLNFWVSRELADAVRQKLLDHKRATRERITITDICTEALQKFINPKEGNEMGNYKVYVGEVGNEQGHFVGSSESLRGAKQIAGRELTSYDGDGWGKITNDTTGERYSREGNASWVGPF